MPPIIKFKAIITNNTNIDLSVTDLFTTKFNKLFNNNSVTNTKFFTTKEELILNHIPSEVDEILIDETYNAVTAAALEDWSKIQDLKINIVFRYTGVDSYAVTSDNSNITLVNDNTKADKYRLAYKLNNGTVKYMTNSAGNIATLQLTDTSSLELSDGVSKVDIFLEKVTISI